jgi:hypothetical protein
MSLIRGRRYNRAKNAPHSRPGNTNAAKREDQNEHRVDTAKRLSAQYGVSPATIKRDGADAALLDKHPEKAAAVIRGEVKKSQVMVRADPQEDRPLLKYNSSQKNSRNLEQCSGVMARFARPVPHLEGGLYQADLWFYYKEVVPKGTPHFNMEN